MSEMKKIGWKACFVNNVTDSRDDRPDELALVKLEIDPDDIISDPSIRIKRGNTDPFMLHALDNFNKMVDLLKDSLLNRRDSDIFRLACDAYCERVLHCMKCRATKAKVLEIYPFDKGVTVTHARSIYEPTFIYRKGEYVSPANIDEIIIHHAVPEGITVEDTDICGPGIHYFEDWRAAVLYSSVSCTAAEHYDMLFGEVIFKNGKNS